MSEGSMTFQDMIFALQHYWADQGCTVMQPYDSEVGAGTFHTATLLRALGKKPWAAIVSPAVVRAMGAMAKIRIVCSTITNFRYSSSHRPKILRISTSILLKL